MIKKWLYRLLSEEKYLQTISKAYFFQFETGRLKKDPEYASHYFLDNFIEKGDCVIDIGANLGYYSVILSRLVGATGQVWAVEPMKLFRTVLHKNLKRSKYDNVEIIPFALGSQDDSAASMGTTVENGVFRHGLTKIVEDEETNYDKKHQVKIYRPSTIFRNIKRLDYIKCDVEGYETVVIPEMLSLINKFRPIIQIEIGPLKHRNQIFDLLEDNHYKVYSLKGQTIWPVKDRAMPYDLDFYIIPKEKLEKYRHLITESISHEA